MVSAGGFGLVYGLSARAAGFSPIEAGAMSLFVFAGASQFVAVGYVLGGFSWIAVLVLTAFLNARHFLYGAALAPYLGDVPRRQKAVHGPRPHGRGVRPRDRALPADRPRSDVRGYWIGAIVSTWIPWNLATLVGVTIGGSIPDPTRFGLDVIFPAAMAGLAVGLVTGRRELVAAIAGAVIGVGVALAWDPAAGIIAGGVLGPVLGMVAPAKVASVAAPDGAPRDLEPGPDPAVGIPS